VSHWLSKVVDLLNTETADLRQLAKLAGGNPKTFYRGARLDGVDLSGQDLRGMEFTDVDFSKFSFDEKTKLDWRYMRAKSRVQSKGSVLTDAEFHDVDWADKWLRKWPGSSARRELMTAEGEALLRLHPIDKNWSRVWNSIWLNERRNSPRRNSLKDLALIRIAEDMQDNWGWLIVFKRLWKSASVSERKLLKARFEDGFRWLATLQRNTDPSWFNAWIEYSFASRVSHSGSDFVFAQGLDWLSSQNFNHPNWKRVWKHLWTLSKDNSNGREVLRTLGLNWLTRVDPRAPGWSSVWRRIWRASLHSRKDVDELLKNAEWWLDTHRTDSGWVHVWQEVFKHSSDQDWLRVSGFDWLKKNTTNKKWISVWVLLRRGTQSIEFHQQLDENAREWLHQRPQPDDWPRPWLELWNFGGQHLDKDLRVSAEKWLENAGQSTLRDSISAIISKVRESGTA
jgi:hypothetical protein